jgi:hypothetical protein
MRVRVDDLLSHLAWQRRSEIPKPVVEGRGGKGMMRRFSSLSAGAFWRAHAAMAPLLPVWPGRYFCGKGGCATTGSGVPCAR